MMTTLQSRKQEVDALCRKHRVAYLAVFGSATGNEFNEASDIDFLVRFDAGLSARQQSLAYFGLQADLELLFRRRVDLVTMASLTNPYFRDSVMAKRRELYAA